MRALFDNPILLLVALGMPLVLGAVVLAAVYGVVRLAVRHGAADADRLGGEPGALTERRPRPVRPVDLGRGVRDDGAVFPVPEGFPVWVLAAVPAAVLAVLVVNLVVRSRRGEFGQDAGGRRRAPWLWPVLIGVGAFAVLKLVTDR